MKHALQHQVPALIRRHLIVFRRTFLRSLIRMIGWPVLVIAFLFYIHSTMDPELSKHSPFADALYLILPAITFFQCLHFAESVVRDKETGFRSLMYTMGLRRVSYFTTYVLISSACLLPLMIAMAVLSVMYIFQETQSSQVGIVLIMIIYVFQLSGLFLFITSFITKTSFTVLLYLIVFLELIAHGQIAKLTTDLSSTSRQWALFAASSLPHESIKLLTESYAVCKNCDTSQTSQGRVSQPTSWILVAMIFWTVVYHTLATWFDQVCPWKNDEVPRSPIFCLKKNDPAFKLEGPHESESFIRSKYFESSNTQRHVGIRIVDVKKFYNNTPVVDDVTFNIYKGETTLLLGHNGAGKTTLMNIILNKISPDEGGVSVAHTKDRNVGYCPQTSILDDDLTVRQHLELFHDLKMNSSQNVSRRQDVTKTMSDICLMDHKEKVPSELSGGMKRKLSLGLAFVGQSSVLILDEPSSGLDPDSRLTMWNTIRQYRSDRTVLLSTQHMEEADYLGDRIAIMGEGKIRCCGSSIFLNELFGSGYKLRVECRTSTRDKIVQLVKSYFKAAEVSRDEQSRATPSKDSDPLEDLVFQLRAGSKSIDYELNLIKLLEDIEKKSSALKIVSHGLRSSSIEDVMLNSGKEFLLNDQQMSSSSVSLSTAHLHNLTNPARKAPSSWFAEQVYFMVALMIKHFHTYRREWKSILFFRFGFMLIGAYSASAELRDLYFSPTHTIEIFKQMSIIHLIYYPALEKATKFKTMQLTTQSNLWIYWFSFLIVDIISIILFLIAFIVIMDYHTPDNLLRESKLQVFFIAGSGTFLFGVSATVLAYTLSHFTNDAKESVGFHSLFYYAVPILEMIAAALKFTGYLDIQTLVKTIASILIPTYSLSYIFQGIVENCYVANPFIACTKPPAISSKLALGFTYLCGQILIYGILLCVMELNHLNLPFYFSLRNVYRMIFKSNALKQHHAMQDLDSDVLDETNKAEALIDNPSQESHSLIAADLSKSYIYGIPIVKQLSFTVNRGECFGLLGVNGAGKSTTFSLVVGESKPDSGKLWLNGHYSQNSITDYRHRLSYDPQASPDIPLSPSELLTCMARLRRIKEESIPQLVDSTLEILNMYKHGKKSATDLSGGTQRKLALGMSLIGCPEFLALDEPTAGIDPLARRDIWQLLQSMRTQNGCSILISSHAMEECEAICNRISIMAKGKLRCIGTFLHLRSKFAHGCTIRLEHRQVAGSDCSMETFNAKVNDLLQKLQSHLGASVKLTDINVNNASLAVTDSSIKRSTILKLLRDFKSINSNLNYMLNDSSLEDIFIALAREQSSVSAGD